MHKLALVVMFVSGVAAADTAKKPAPKKPLPYGRVAIGTPTITGALDDRALYKVLKANQHKLDHCYRQGRAKDATLEGKATAMFAVAPSGKVDTATLVGMQDAGVEKCLIGVISRMVFAKPRDGKKVEVEYPLLFDPHPNAAFASLTGTASNEIYGGLIGNEKGEMSGGFGYGRSGFGPGGGGTGVGTIGIGRYGQIGHGSGTGSGYGLGGGASRKVPAVTIGQPNAQGSLDKAIIRRYIRRNMLKLQYCYEKELVTKPSLSGTLHASFTIGVEGRVVSSTASGVDAAVESCVAGVIASIEFPKPQAGEVFVRYPFTFRAPESPKKK